MRLFFRLLSRQFGRHANSAQTKHSEFNKGKAMIFTVMKTKASTNPHNIFGVKEVRWPNSHPLNITVIG